MSPNFGPTFIGLTGTPAADRRTPPAPIASITRRCRARTAAPYLMDHSSIVYLLDRNGRFVTHFTHEAKAETIAAAVGRCCRPHVSH